jgi:hypothetical protein
MMRVRIGHGKSAMFALVRHFYQLLLLQRAPQDFPASAFLLVLVLLLDLLAGFMINWAASGELLYALLRTMLACGLILGGSFILLSLFGHKVRWLQTSIALLGGDALLMLMAAPFFLVVTFGISNVFLEMSLLLFLVWQVAFVGHVWRHALDTNMLLGIVIALGLIVWYAYIEIQLLPFPSTAEA